jgi:glycosyltransferase involved in cell wall biosynthesis
MVLYDTLAFDSRVQREANALAAAGHHVTILCLDGSHETAPMLDRRVRVMVVRQGGRTWSPGEGNPFVTATGLGRHIARLRFLATYAQNLRRWGRGIARQPAGFDVWHAHDFTGLVAASMARGRGASLVYDMHDLFLETVAGARLPTVGRTLLLRYERRLSRRADLVVTVNQGLAAWARSNLRPRSIAVVHNCVPRTPPIEPRPTRIRDALGLSPSTRVVLYHGSIGANRGLEQLYEAMLCPGLDEAHLVLLGFGPDRERLQAIANETRFGGRIHLLEPVLPGELVAWVASADVGVMPNQPRTLNERLSTPNKLFESLAAGLPVISSDFPERRRIIMDDPLGPLGAVCDPTRPVAIADAIRSVLVLDVAAYDDLRRRCSMAAQVRWNWEREAATLVDAYRRIAQARARRTGPR